MKQFMANEGNGDAGRACRCSAGSGFDVTDVDASDCHRFDRRYDNRFDRERLNDDMRTGARIGGAIGGQRACGT